MTDVCCLFTRTRSHTHGTPPADATHQHPHRGCQAARATRYAGYPLYYYHSTVGGLGFWVLPSRSADKVF